MRPHQSSFFRQPAKSGINKKAQMTIQSSVLFYYFLKIPNGFPTGKTTFPKCVFNTAAAEP